MSQIYLIPVTNGEAISPTEKFLSHAMDKKLFYSNICNKSRLKK